ncbi:MAG: hypothetical protein KY463_15720 [Actinobacteria bacterium]|nr:hypothetical protein [Actinomycetota bacterium]
MTVDHQLQAGSADRARDVARMLRGLGLAPVEELAVSVPHGGGPEAAARTARYAALDEAAQRLGAGGVLLDDNSSQRTARESVIPTGVLAALGTLAGLFR